MANFSDASFEHALPLAAPAIAEVVTNAVTFTAMSMPGTLDAAAQRYHLRIEPVAVDYEIRFRGETTGHVVPANTVFEPSGALVVGAVPSIRASAGTPTVRCLVSWPSRA